MISFNATSVYEDTITALEERIQNDKDKIVVKYKIILQEGSSRSSKTWSNFQVIFMYAYSKHYKSIAVVRDVAKDCHDILETDWIKWISDPNGRLKQYENGEIELKEALELMAKEELSKHFVRNKQKHTWTCKKTKSVIQFTGLDSDVKVMGMTNDLVWVNEPYAFSEEIFKQLLQRTKQILFDWNPREAHFINKNGYKKRVDTITLHSTFLDNPFCPEESMRQLLAYQSIRFSDVVVSDLISEKEAQHYNFEENKLLFTKRQMKELQRCIYNEETNSASDYHWQVYGLGIGAERPNRIFKWKPIPYSEYLAVNRPVWYGVDWGKVDPFGIIEAKYEDGKLYIHELNYLSENGWLNDAKKLSDTEKYQINKQHAEGFVIWLFNKLGVNKDRPVICDNNRPAKIKALREAGYEQAIAADKPPGSKLDGIDILSKLEVYYTSCSKNVEYEQENYSYATDKKGEQLEEPEDGNDHTIDPTRYVVNKLRELGIIKIV